MALSMSGSTLMVRGEREGAVGVGGERAPSGKHALVFGVALSFGAQKYSPASAGSFQTQWLLSILVLDL